MRLRLLLYLNDRVRIHKASRESLHEVRFHLPFMLRYIVRNLDLLFMIRYFSNSYFSVFFHQSSLLQLPLRTEHYQSSTA